MSVHEFIPGTESVVLLILSSLICLTGLIIMFVRYGHGNPFYFFTIWRKDAFKEGKLTFLNTLVFDVLFFRRVWVRSKYRWTSHMMIFWSFLILGGFILISLISILFKVLNPNGFGGYFAQYLYNLHLPYDLLAYFLLVACIFNIFRRLFLKKVLERTSMRDFFILISIFIIGFTGILSEWFSGYGTFIGNLILDWNTALQVMQFHLYAVFLLFIMVIPWTRFKHIITTPLVILARRGE